MIINLSGAVTYKDGHYVVIENQGVGYQVFMPPTALAVIATGSQVKVWIHDNVKEDGHDLYGFTTQGDYRLFLKLLGVSGVGPKSAMNILALGSSKDIEMNIEKADVDWLTRVPGIGKKTAQKIVLELKGKLALGEAGGDEEVVTALVGLGYSRDQARDALAGAGASSSVEDRLRTALRTLGR
jgi:Holliday junction DNA helicase RuvA